MVEFSWDRGQNVEEAFLKTASLIFQSVQDGRSFLVLYFSFHCFLTFYLGSVDLSSDGGVTRRPTPNTETPGVATPGVSDNRPQESDCAC